MSEKLDLQNVINENGATSSDTEAVDTKTLGMDIIFFFKEVIDDQTLRLGITSYDNLSVNGLAKEFVIGFGKFKKLIEDHDTSDYCKFYFLVNNKQLNIGIAFSQNNDLNLVTSDHLFELSGDEFIQADFTLKREEFKKPDGMKDQIKLAYPTKEVTEMICYDLGVISFYNLLVSHSFKVEKLKFKMFQFPATYKRSDKAGRLSFAVNPMIIGLGDDKTNSFDAGDLKP